jgi:septum formation protein
MKKKIILASGSPRRKELLEKAGLVFDIVISDYEENMSLPLSPSELAKYLSRGKAEAVAQRVENAVIISADTFISHKGKIIGKPHVPEKAKEMLRNFSGKTHSVITGFTIHDTADKKTISRAVETKVFFRELTDEEIDGYVATGEPLDKAGAYAIQGGASGFIEKIEGDYDNVVGLPVGEVLKILFGEFGDASIF